MALVLLVAQVAGGHSGGSSRDLARIVLERASKEANLDQAGLVLSSLLADEATIRSAFAAAGALDDRSNYILFGGNWGPLANVSRRQRVLWSQALTESVSARPDLIRPVLRAGRLEAYLTARFRRGSESGIPFFSTSRYADDVAEFFVERLRKESSQPPRAILLYNHVVETAEEHETQLLANWQMLCGLCDRLDLVAKSTTKNWRDRFPDLGKWFHENRPFVTWNETKSCMIIDHEAKEWGAATERSSRSIPDLKPSWLNEERKRGQERKRGHNTSVRHDICAIDSARQSDCHPGGDLPWRSQTTARSLDVSSKGKSVSGKIGVKGKSVSRENRCQGKIGVRSS
jgi:hypothetical protein